jgi:hypothetical protein
MKLLILEIWFYLQVPLTWYAFKRFAKRDVLGELLAGTIIGCFIEFVTEPLWNYHFRFTIYKDVAPCIVIGWGVMFTLVVSFSEKLYKTFLRTDKVVMTDKRIFVFDVIAAAVVAFPIETIALKLGVFDYNYNLLKWNWGEVPFFKMPYEALFGYCLLMLIGPTFVRCWEKPFEACLEKL